MKSDSENHVDLLLRYRRRRRRRLILAFLCLLLAGVSFAASYVFGMDAWDRLDLTRITDVDCSLIVTDALGNEVTTLHAGEDRIPVALADIPKHTRDAFISAEDARFYDHFGVDIVRILGAAWADIKAGGYVQGASTISQQLIKLSHLTNEKKMERKLEEAVLAYQLERRCSKETILEMYLNYVYFGGGYYGIEAAARGYFGVHASELTVAQSAQLAGILKSPSKYAPHLNPEKSLERRNLILGLMRDYGFLSEQECAQARAEGVELNRAENTGKRGYYVDLALTEAVKLLGIPMNELLSGGYTIETAMDAGMQETAERLFRDDASFPACADTPCEGAFAVVDTETGGIAALVGGREQDVALALNRAVSIRRQPGSVIKPILVYAPALENGYTAATMLLDEEMDFDGYRPGNSNDRFSGWVTMREAVTRSLNVPAVSVFSQIGVEPSKRFARRVGIEFDERDTSLALALGGFTYGVSPVQVAGAYAAFASGGIYTEPYVIERILDRDGQVLYDAKPERIRVMREANAYVLTSMLESVLQKGTGRRLGALDIPLAGKTGTTGDETGNRDIWMAAYNADYAAAVWMGFDSAADGILPDDATGGTYPALLLKQFFAERYADEPAPDFPIPDGIRVYRIDRRTLDTEHIAVLANALTPENETYEEVFVEGTEPGDMTSYWQIPSPPARIGATAGDGAVLVYFETPNPYVLYRIYREDAAGKSVLIHECAGTEGSIAFEDTAIPRKGRYTYYVIPVHPLLTVGGESVAGESSVRVTVNVG